jgi:hypothetical protein
MFNLLVLAHDLDVPKLGEIEISLFLKAINQELQFSDLRITSWLSLSNFANQEESRVENSYGTTFDYQDSPVHHKLVLQSWQGWRP